MTRIEPQRAVAPAEPTERSAADAAPNMGARATGDPRRWRALAVLGLVQFMLVLDISVVNVALPRIQHDLGFSQAGLAWVVNGYVLMAGGLMLIGGRAADMYGRRRSFMIGVGVFAIASAACGAAQSPGLLVASRFAQGLGEAVAGPASLGLVVLLFPDPQERVKALGIWGGLAGLGGTFGTVISGGLTDLASWRWIFFVNLPVAAFALLAVPRLVNESRMQQRVASLDYAGALIATGGLVTLVLGLLRATSHQWGSWAVVLPCVGGVVLLAVAVGVESRSASPLIPRGFFRERTRVVANGVSLAFAGTFLSYVFLMTLFEQQVLRFSPLQSGLSYLPLGLGIGAGMGIGTALIGRLGVKPVLVTSFVVSAVGLLMSSMISVTSSYLGTVLPGMLVLAVGNGLGFPALSNAALTAVTEEDSSLAAAIQATMQQVGGALGLAVLVTIAVRLAHADALHGHSPGTAATHGYQVAFRIAAAVLVAAAAVAASLAHPRTREAVAWPNGSDNTVTVPM